MAMGRRRAATGGDIRVRWTAILPILLGLLPAACSGLPPDLPAPVAGPPLLAAPQEFSVHGIDVSKYQGEIDWEAARQGGVAFAYIKATEGGDRIDPTFLANWNGAAAAGIPRGAYHFWYFCRPAAEQMAWFKSQVPVDPKALPPVLDMEWNPDSPTCRLRPPRDEVLREMRAALKELERNYGKRPVIYVSVDFHRDRLVDELSDYPFWVRSVAGYPTLRYDRRKWTFWQYTGTGRVAGVTGEVDRNVFAGSPQDWKSWLAGKAHHRSIERH